MAEWQNGRMAEWQNGRVACQVSPVRCFPHTTRTANPRWGADVLPPLPLPCNAISFRPWWWGEWCRGRAPPWHPSHPPGRCRDRTEFCQKGLSGWDFCQILPDLPDLADLADVADLADIAHSITTILQCGKYVKSGKSGRPGKSAILMNFLMVMGVGIVDQVIRTWSENCVNSLAWFSVYFNTYHRLLLFQWVACVYTIDRAIIYDHVWYGSCDVMMSPKCHDDVMMMSSIVFTCLEPVSHSVNMDCRGVVIGCDHRDRLIAGVFQRQVAQCDSLPWWLGHRAAIDGIFGKVREVAQREASAWVEIGSVMKIDVLGAILELYKNVVWGSD